MLKQEFTVDCKIAETLLIPLYARAREQQQSQPLLVDPQAAQLAERIDYDFKKFEQAPASLIGAVLRSAYFDEIVRQFIQQHAEPIVVHLGYGLDTRVQRLGQQTNKAGFYQIDTTQVIAYRQSLIDLQPNEHYIATCLFDFSWMDTLQKNHPRAMFIFILEGVLMYCEPQKNKQLFAELATRFQGAEIHFDVLSSWLSAQTYLHDAVKLTRAEFKFGIDNDRLIETWHPQLEYQGSLDLMRLKGWHRSGWAYLMGQALYPPLGSASRVVAYLIKNKTILKSPSNKATFLLPLSHINGTYVFDSYRFKLLI